MSYTIPESAIINYPPETLRNFKVSVYEWIDNLHFTLCVNDVMSNPEDYLQIAREMFLEAGWDGDGEIRLMWIPPFMLKESGNTLGVTLWHVKQTEDGISWLLSDNEW